MDMRHSNVTKLSEATALAVHAMVFLASTPDHSWSVKAMAPILKASEAHLSKVMQRLSMAGLVSSERGPKGGFVLLRKAEDIKLIEIYELFEGPIQEGGCLLAMGQCPLGGCKISAFLGKINAEVREFFSQNTLADLTLKGL